MVNVDRAELAALDPAPQDGADQAEAAANHLVEVEAREIREVASLSDHQLGNRPDLRARHVGDGRQQLLQQADARPFEGRGRHLEPLEVRQQPGPHHRLEQRFLAGEVQVERALADAGAGRDVVQAGRGEATRGEALQGRCQNLVGAVVLAAAPAGRRTLVHGRAVH